jgi:hypothetical protein
VIITIGWLGTFLYLINHIYISLETNWKNNIYYGGNTLAAICLIISSYYNASWQAVVINIFWASISIALLLGANLSTIKLNKRFFYIVFIGMSLMLFVNYLMQSQFDLALLGWISAFIFSGAYLLFSAKKMLPRYYLCWNAFAAIALLPQLWLDHNWPVFALEVIWASISIYGAARKFEQVHLI